MAARVASGSFASVYRIERAAEKWAVRCFLRQGADQARYALLSRYLSGLSVSGLVEFAFLPQGIRVRAQWYPIVKMEWVEGITLQSYVAAHVRCWEAEEPGAPVARADGPAAAEPDRALRFAAWQRAGNAPGAAPPGRLRRHVRARPEGPAEPRTGAPQLPAPAPRRRGLHGEPRRFLRHRHLYRIARAHRRARPLGALRFGREVLFSAPDFQSPGQSPLFGRLLQSPDAGVRSLATVLAQSCAGAPAAAPDFKRLVDSLPPVTEPEPWWQEAVRSQRSRRPPPQVPPLPAGITAAAGKRSRGGSRAASHSTVPMANDPDASLADSDREPDPAGEGSPAPASPSGAPWWTKRPSTLVSELRTPDWMTPVSVAAVARTRLRRSPVLLDTIVKRHGWPGAICLACVMALSLWLGLSLALQLLERGANGPPPQRPGSSRPASGRLAAPRP